MNRNTLTSSTSQSLSAISGGRQTKGHGLGFTGARMTDAAGQGQASPLREVLEADFHKSKEG